MNNSILIDFLPDLLEIGNSEPSHEGDAMPSSDSLAYVNKPSKPTRAVTAIQNSAPVSENLISDAASSDKLYSTLTLSEGTVLKPWKNVANISSRILDIYDDVVLVECLVDRELMQYVETELPSSLFRNFELTIGQYCIIMHYERESSLHFEVNANPNLDLSSDFPSIDFSQEFKDSILFKRK